MQILQNITISITKDAKCWDVKMFCSALTEEYEWLIIQKFWDV